MPGYWQLPLHPMAICRFRAGWPALLGGLSVAGAAIWLDRAMLHLHYDKLVIVKMFRDMQLRMRWMTGQLTLYYSANLPLTAAHASS